jgi:hypothetical protein
MSFRGVARSLLILKEKEKKRTFFFTEIGLQRRGPQLVDRRSVHARAVKDARLARVCRHFFSQLLTIYGLWFIVSGLGFRFSRFRVCRHLFWQLLAISSKETHT